MSDSNSLLYKISAAPAPFRDSHPLAFSLYNRDGHAILYIADDPGEASLTVDLRNTATRVINLLSLNDKNASNKNYHFQLIFRPGVLSKFSVERYVAQQQIIDQWSIWGEKDALSEQVSLYLLHTTKESIATLETLLLSDLPLSAAASAGARGTQVEMLPNPEQVQYASDEKITGGQLEHLQIISHQGMREIPLQVGFIGFHRILNDGQSTNKLVLEIKNQLTSEDRGMGVIKLTPTNDNTPKPTKLILSFDESTNPWGLGKSDIKLSLTDTETPNTKWQIDPGSENPWVIRPLTSGLDPKDTLILYVNDITTNSPSGLTNLSLRYENIPGYWDGEFTCPIEKAPLVFGSGDGYQNNIGIGVQADQTHHQLTLGDKNYNYAGLQQENGGLVFRFGGNKLTASKEGLRIDGNGNIGIGTPTPQAKLSINGGLHVGGDADPGDKNLQVDGKLIVNSNIGIGTLTPQAKLSINGGLHVGGDADPGDKNLQVDGKLIVNNNIGIGTTTPQAKLSINGGLHVGGDADPGDKNLQVDGKLIFGGNLESTSFQPADRYLTLKVEGGNTYRSGIKFWAWQENYGYSIQHDERYKPRAGLRINAHNRNVDGNTLMFFDWASTNIGIGADNPQSKLHIIDQPKNADNGTLILGPIDGANLRLGYDTNYSWIQSHGGKSLAINPIGNKVGIGTTNPTLGTLHVEGDIYCSGTIFAKDRLCFYWGPDKKWKHVQNLINQYAGSYDTTAPSDARFKTAVHSIEDALAKILQLRGTYFHWSDDGLKYFTSDIEKNIFAGPEASEQENQQVWETERSKRLAQLTGNQIGLIAQEVEAILPEVVHTDEEGYKSIDYGHISALLIEAIKDQQKLITALTKRVNEFENSPA